MYCGKMLSTSILSNTSRCLLPRSSKICGCHRAVATATAAAMLPLLFLLLLLQLHCVVCVLRVPNDIRPHSMAHFKPNRTIIVQLFEWKFADVAAECENFLGPKGYAGVQLSPVTEHLLFESETLKNPWWQRYHPVTYVIASRSGNEEDFLAMSRTCNAAGVRIYVDVVLNHMAGGALVTAAEGDEAGALQGFAESRANASALVYPGVPYVSGDFHKPCPVNDYMDGHEVRNCQLDGRPDLDHSRAGVRANIVKLLDKLVDMGAAGFCVDAAKYMWPLDLKNIFNAVKNLSSDEFDFPAQARPFFYQNVFDLGIDAISKTEYSGNGVITEYLYAAELATVFSGRAPLSALINWGPVMGFVPHDDALVFADTHESQRSALKQLGQNHLLTFRWPSRYIMANAFMLVHPYGGIKRIMSSYRFEADAVDQGPPTADDDDTAAIRAPEFDDEGLCTPESGWVCEHRWPAIANMIELVNSLDEVHDSVINFQTDGPQHIGFCRGHKAFIALNNDAVLDYEREVFTCLEAGTYCDIISGGIAADGGSCQGRWLVVNAEGKARLTLPAVGTTQSQELDEHNEAVVEFGVIVIYIGSKLGNEAAAALAAKAGVQANAAVADERETTETDVKGEYEIVEVKEATENAAPPAEDSAETVDGAVEEVAAAVDEAAENAAVVSAEVTADSAAIAATETDATATELVSLNEAEPDEAKTVAASKSAAVVGDIKMANLESMKFSALD